MQQTRLQSLFLQIGSYLSTSLVGSWKIRSIGLISLLIGNWFGGNIPVYYLEERGQRVTAVILLVLVVELLVRLRTRVNRQPWPIHWIALDNFRIGTTYSIVFEAFKLGS